MSFADALRRRPEILATLGTYCLEVGLVALAFAIHQGTAEGATGFQARRLQLILFSGVGLALFALLALSIAFRAAQDHRRQRFWAPVILNLIVVGVLLGFIEAALRVISQPHALGQRIGSTVLLPYDWRSFAAANLELLQKSRSKAAYFVEDPVLGWSIAPSRTSADGLYSSSVEGLRSAFAGERLAATPAPPRVAITGDSFIFSEEVPYEDSLARFLEEKLPEPTQILNFGVPGYGVDQAVLRVEQGLAKWRPQVAVLGFIQDDFNRNLNVYAFLKVDWATPMSKPRFVARGGALELLNFPNLPPDEIFARESIFDLPLLDHDVEFDAYQWRRRPLHASYLFRYLTAAFPAWPQRTAQTAEEAVVALGPLIVERFVSSMRNAGTIPLVLYLPSRGDFQGSDRKVRDQILEAAARRGVAEIVDLTECLLERVPESELFLKNGVHYSRRGNQAAAECLTILIAPHLSAS